MAVLVKHHPQCALLRGGIDGDHIAIGPAGKETCHCDGFALERRLVGRERTIALKYEHNRWHRRHHRSWRKHACEGVSELLEVERYIANVPLRRIANENEVI